MGTERRGAVRGIARDAFLPTTVLRAYLERELPSQLERDHAGAGGARHLVEVIRVRVEGRSWARARARSRARVGLGLGEG